MKKAEIWQLSEIREKLLETLSARNEGHDCQCPLSDREVMLLVKAINEDRRRYNNRAKHNPDFYRHEIELENEMKKKALERKAEKSSIRLTGRMKTIDFEPEYEIPDPEDDFDDKIVDASEKEGGSDE